jgi:hypothetical protein
VRDVCSAIVISLRARQRLRSASTRSRSSDCPRDLRAGPIRNARGALRKLSGMGLGTVIQPVKVETTVWYRVRVGPYAAEGAALAALARIRKNGYADARLVRPEAGPVKGN